MKGKNSKYNTYKNNRNSGSDHRYDSLMDLSTGRGTSLDKLEALRPKVHNIPPTAMREWYLANGFVQNIIDAPAEDATREWITIKTNRDSDLSLSRKIINRMSELKIQSKIKDLIRFSRMYSEGGFLYYGIKSDLPQTDSLLNTAIPAQILKLEYLNVFGPDSVSINHQGYNPLSSDYHRPEFSVSGVRVHTSRLEWLVHSYIPEERKGVSVIETILDAVKAQDTALWSVTSVIYEMAVKVFKSPDIIGMDPEKVAAFLAKMKAVINTQAAVALGKDEELTRIQDPGIANGIKQLFDFIFENLAGLARIPKSRLMGQAQGVITAGQYDLLTYYDTVAKFQELEMRPIVEKIIKLVINETEGEIYRELAGETDSLDWEFEFNPLWKLAPQEAADIDLKNAQSDQIYMTTAVLSPTDVRSKRFKELESFGAWDKTGLNFRPPVTAPPVSVPANNVKKAAEQGANNSGNAQNEPAA